MSNIYVRMQKDNGLVDKNWLRREKYSLHNGSFRGGTILKHPISHDKAWQTMGSAVCDLQVQKIPHLHQAVH
jgi:hypothetical protein